MDQQNNTNKNTEINIENYLTTQAVNPNSISQNQMSSDLSQLSTAEEKSKYKANIAKGIRNPQVQTAVSALRLANPFKGY